MNSFKHWLAAALLAILLLGSSQAADEKNKKLDDAKPAIRMAMPLAVVSGAKTKVTLRGLKLEEASEVRSTSGEATVKITSKGKAGGSDKQDAKKIGDTQVEFEFTPAESFSGEAVLTVVTPSGESEAYRLLVVGKDKFVAEKESSGFLDAQPLEEGKLLLGSIGGGRDVDVFQYEAKAGEKITFDVQAARRGAATDPLLTLYNRQGQVLATLDDLPDSPDATITYTFATAGAYYLGLQDANDLSGIGYGYVLQATVAP